MIRAPLRAPSTGITDAGYKVWLGVFVLRVTANAVATGSPQDESVRCADLWPVHLGAAFKRETARPPSPRLRRGRQCRGYRRRSGAFLLFWGKVVATGLLGAGLKAWPSLRVRCSGVLPERKVRQWLLNMRDWNDE